MDFLQKPSAWFSNFYLRVQSKNCGKNSFFCFSFQIFFGFWAKNFSDFQPKNFRKLSKLPSACPEEHFVTLIFLKKFWIVLDLLQKPLAWFPNFYLRVQSKNCGKNSFFLFFSRIFSNFEQNFFQTFGQKTSKSFQNYLRVQRKSLWLGFFKFSNVSDFLQKQLAWFSKFYLRVQSKNCGKNRFFLFSFQIFFRILSKNFSDFRPKNFKKVFKTTYMSRGKVCDLVFFKLSNVSDFLQKHLAWFSKFYLRVQSKNCGKNSFFCFLCRTFSNFEQNFFRLSAKKLQKNFQNYLRVQRNSLLLESFF